MHAQCMVAVYETRNAAEQACRAVREAGVPEDHIRLSRAENANFDDVGGTTGSARSEPANETLWDWLFGSEVPEEHQRMYASGFSAGNAAVSVYVDDAPSIANASVVEDILERYDPLDLHLDGGQPLSGAAGTEASAAGGQEQQVIPLPEEELKVGKQATERVRHVRIYVVEEPVEQDVSLRDERVVIEKRPSTGTAAGGEPMEREYEIRERHEEPVVEKSTKAGEELVVRKEQSDRTERVRDTVKKTKADVDSHKG